MQLSNSRWCRQKERRSLRNSRQGYLYVAVLFTTLLVAALTMTGLRLQADKLNAQRYGVKWLEARTLADSAISQALALIRANPNWRSTYTHGTVVGPQSYGGGTVSFSLHDDSDNSLSNDLRQRVRVRGIGVAGNTRYVRSVLLEPAGPGVPCLDYAVCVNSGFTPSSTVFWSTDGVFGFNGPINTVPSSTIISADVNFRLSQSQYWTSGISTMLGEDIQMPGSDWSNFYNQEATTIPISALPLSGGYRQIHRQALGPNRNPFGSTNRLGLYSIDCQGQSISISRSRIRGTLLLKNLGANSVVRDAIDWVPAVAHFPALLVQGNIHLRTSYSRLDENDEGTNFNPTGMVPSDTDLDDDYPSRIYGLIYVTGTARVGDPSTRMFLHGALVCGSIIASGNFSVQTIPDLRQNAPPGFRTSPAMQIVPGSWKREEG